MKLITDWLRNLNDLKMLSKQLLKRPIKQQKETTLLIENGKRIWMMRQKRKLNESNRFRDKSTHIRKLFHNSNYGWLLSQVQIKWSPFKMSFETLNELRNNLKSIWKQWSEELSIKKNSLPKSWVTLIMIKRLKTWSFKLKKWN